MEDVLREWGAAEVSAMEVYADVFKLGEGFIQREGESPGEHKANPIIIGKPYGTDRIVRRIMFEDTFEEQLSEFQGFEWAFLNGLTYWGRANSAANQSKMCAMVFDLDGVDEKRLNAFLSGAIRAQAYPVPNYVILSGHGLHLYYVLEQPVSLYPNVKTQLKELKYALTDRMWNRYTSNDERVQHQGINQGFRIVGGKTKDGDTVRAFRLSDSPTWIDQLNEFVPEASRVDSSRLWRESKLTLAKAKEKYPEWYERRIVGSCDPGRWTVKRDLYDWWKRRIEGGEVSFGHRYFCVMCLAIYGVKCGIDAEEVERDALALIPHMNEIEPNEPFTESDVRSALECFDERYVRFPRNDISRLSGVPVPVNKRNGQKQAFHLEEARAIRDIRQRRKGANWWDGGNRGGAPTKEQLIKDYAAAHPDASHVQIAKALGVSRTTVVKWLK